MSTNKNHRLLSLNTILKIVFFAVIVTCIMIFYFYLKPHIKSNDINGLALLVKDMFGFWLPLILFIIFVMSNFAGLPTWYLGLLAGVFYGLFWGILYVWAATLIGISLVFFACRYLFRQNIVNKFGNNKALVKVENYLKKYGNLTIIMTRAAIIVPFNVQNYIYGLTGVKSLNYVICTGIGIIPSCFLIVFGGYAIKKGIMLNRQSLINENMHLLLIISGILIMVVTAAILFVIFRKKLSRKNDGVAD